MVKGHPKKSGKLKNILYVTENQANNFNIALIVLSFYIVIRC